MPKAFRMMKASPIETEEDYGRIRYPVYGSPKYDGIRIGCHPQMGPVTNTLKDIPNAHIRKWMSHSALFGLDGEIIVGDPRKSGGYSDTQSAFSSHGGEPHFKFFVFDDFSSASTQCRFAIRLEDVKVKVEQCHQRGLNFVELVHHERLESRSELDEYCSKMGEYGFEGACFRARDGIYKFGRSTLNEGHLLKYKPFVDAEAVIEGFFDLERNLNAPIVDARGLQTRGYSKAGKVVDESMVGGVEARVLNGQFAGAEINVGSGLDDATREDMKRTPDKYLGKTFTFKYQKHGSKDLPRSPIWKGLRFDV
jgi:DNA ligase-1